MHETKILVMNVLKVCRYSFFSFEYVDLFDQYAAYWFTLI